MPKSNDKKSDNKVSMLTDKKFRTVSAMAYGACFIDILLFAALIMLLESISSTAGLILTVATFTFGAVAVRLYECLLAHSSEHQKAITNKALLVFLLITLSVGPLIVFIVLLPEMHMEFIKGPK